jgi:hypothetical protein
MKLNDMEFAEWLVPQRSKVQAQLLRLYQLMDEVKDRQKLFESDREWTALQLLIGAGFSLWRAVFQAQSDLDHSLNFDEAKKFLELIILDNAVNYRDEKKSWSFGYYLNNAKFRLVRVFDAKLLIDPNVNPELAQLIARYRDTIPKKGEAASTATCDDLIRALELTIDILGQRIKQTHAA